MLGDATGTPPAASGATTSGATKTSDASPTLDQKSVPAMIRMAAQNAGQATGISPDYLTRTAQIESNFDPNAVSSTGAKGPWQFTGGTAKRYGLTDPFDVNASASAAARLAADNKTSLQAALGRDPSDAELYLAHQQGAGGAAKLLANPNARAGDVVGDKAVRVNGGDPDMTAGAFANKWIKRYGTAQADLPAAGARNVSLDAPDGAGNGFFIPPPPANDPAPAADPKAPTLGILGQLPGVGSTPMSPLLKPPAPANDTRPRNPVLAGLTIAPTNAAPVNDLRPPNPLLSGLSLTSPQAMGPDQGLSQAPAASPIPLPPARPTDLASAAPLPPARPGAADLPMAGARPAMATLPIGQNGFPVPGGAAPAAPDSSNSNDAGAGAFARDATNRMPMAGGRPIQTAANGSAAPAPTQRLDGGGKPVQPVGQISGPSGITVPVDTNGHPTTSLPGTPRMPSDNMGPATNRAVAMKMFDHWAKVGIQAAQLGEYGKAYMPIVSAHLDLAKGYLQPTDIQKNISALGLDGTPEGRDLMMRALPNNTPTSIQEGEYVTKNPSMKGTVLAMKRAGAQTVTVDQRGENAFSTTLGQARAKRADTTEAALTDAPSQISKLNLASDLLAKASTGKLADIHSNVVGFAQALGASPDTIRGLGLNPNQATTADAANKIINELVVGQIGKGGFPANNFSDADRTFLTKIFPSLTNRPEANAIAIDVLKSVQQRRIDAATSWGDYQDKAETAGQTPNYAKWERGFARDAASKPDLFADAQKRIAALPSPGDPGGGDKTAGGGTTTAAPGRTVDKLDQVPEGALYQTEAGNVYRKQNGRAVFVRKVAQ